MNRYFFTAISFVSAMFLTGCAVEVFEASEETESPEPETPHVPSSPTVGIPMPVVPVAPSAIPNDPPPPNACLDDAGSPRPIGTECPCFDGSTGTCTEYGLCFCLIH